MRKNPAALIVLVFMVCLLLLDGGVSSAFFDDFLRAASGSLSVKQRRKTEDADKASQQQSGQDDPLKKSGEASAAPAEEESKSQPVSQQPQSQPPAQPPVQSEAIQSPTVNYFVPTAVTTHQAPATQPQAAPSQPAAFMQPAAPSQPFSVKRPSVKSGDVSFNFDDADVFSVIQTIFGDVMKVNYIVDPNVKGRVNFRSVSPVAKEDVFPLMEVILRLNGIAVVEEKGLYRIVPIGDISKEPAPVEIGRDPEKVRLLGKSLVQVVPVLYSQSSELTRVLTPFLSKNALIIDIPKTNHIILVDTDANIKRLLQLVEIFDNEQLKQVTPKVFVYPVQNSKAKDVSSLLQQIFLGARPAQPSPAAAQKTPPSAQPSGQPQPAATPAQPQVVAGQPVGGALISEHTRIIPDDITNSIIILASPEDYALIYDTLKKIDIVPRQVMIEALIAEVTLNDTMNFGMQWSIQNDLTVKGLKPLKNDFNLDGTFNLKTPISAPNFTFTALDAAGNIKLMLQSLAGQNKVKILGSPHILVSDNREARIQVGDQVPIATSTTTTTAQAGVTPSITSTIQYKDTGTILKVKPQVNDSGLISLEISQEVSDFTTQSLFGSDQILISKREATSNLVARDGQTIVIGGLIKEKITKNRSGLPFLSKLPVLGYLFGSTTDVNDRTELIILLTPHVIRNQTEARDVTDGYINRLKGLTDIDIKRHDVFPEKGQEPK